MCSNNNTFFKNAFFINRFWLVGEVAEKNWRLLCHDFESFTKTINLNNQFYLNSQSKSKSLLTQSQSHYLYMFILCYFGYSGYPCINALLNVKERAIFVFFRFYFIGLGYLAMNDIFNMTSFKPARIRPHFSIVASNYSPVFCKTKNLLA